MTQGKRQAFAPQDSFRLDFGLLGEGTLEACVWSKQVVFLGLALQSAP